MTDTTKLSELRIQATNLGLSFHHKAGAAKIQALINAHLVQAQQTLTSAAEKSNLPPDTEVTTTPVFDISHLPSTVNLDAEPMTPAQYTAWVGKEQKRTVNRLRRIRLQCMNPTKKDWSGEIISVGSAKLGTFKKFIPYDGEPYHVPEIIYNMLKERQCTTFVTVKSDRPGAPDIRKGKLIKEYAIEDLPPLTTKELDALGKRQALANAGL